MRALKTAYAEAREETPKAPPLYEARKQLARIDFTSASLAEAQPYVKDGISPKNIESRDFVSHLFQPTAAGMGIVAAVARLNGALHAREKLPEEGHDLRNATTDFLRELERRGALGGKKR